MSGKNDEKWLANRSSCKSYIPTLKMSWSDIVKNIRLLFGWNCSAEVKLPLGRHFVNTSMIPWSLSHSCGLLLFPAPASRGIPFLFSIDSTWYLLLGTPQINKTGIKKLLFDVLSSFGPSLIAATHRESAETASKGSQEHRVWPCIFSDALEISSSKEPICCGYQQAFH